MIEFQVYGVPVTQGSARAILHRTTGRPILIPDRSKELRSWREAVASAAARAVKEPLRGPVLLALLFDLLPPKSRPVSLRTDRQVFEWAYPWRRPDADKLARAALDSMTGVLFYDDAQIVDLIVRKRYGVRAGLTVTAESVVFEKVTA